MRDVAELADATDLKSVDFQNREGSSPFVPRKIKNTWIDDIMNQVLLSKSKKEDSTTLSLTYIFIDDVDVARKNVLKKGASWHDDTNFLHENDRIFFQIFSQGPQLNFNKTFDTKTY